MKRIIRAFLWVAPVGCLSFPAYAGISVGAGTEYMVWREFGSNVSSEGAYLGDEQLLEETGVRGYADLSFSVPMTQRAAFQAYGRVYSGDVDYDGQYQDGTPATTVTEYSGGLAEVGLSYNADLADSREEPVVFIANAGVEQWTRNITGAGGYEEEYQITYLRLGAEKKAPEGGWTGRGGIFWPQSVTEKVKLLDGITLEPKGKLSFYVGGGYRFRSGFEMGLNLQTYRFGESDPVAIDSDGNGVNDSQVWQPRSELDTAGLYLKYVY